MTNEFKIKNMNFNELLEKGWFEIESKPKSFKEDLMVEVEDKKRKTRYFFFFFSYYLL